MDAFAQEIPAVEAAEDLSRDAAQTPDLETAKGWRWHHADDSPLPESASYFSYDLEAVPDERFERPEIREAIPISKPGLQHVLKTQATVQLALDDGIPEEQIAELLDMEKAGRARKGVLDKLGKSLKIGNATYRQWTRLAVNPSTAMIVAMSVCDYNDPEPRVWLAKTRDQERDLLQAFFDLIDYGRVRVGFNIAAYDDRLIMWRALRLGVIPSCPMHISRYGGKSSIDLMQKLFRGVDDAIKLKTLLPLVGIHPPAGDTDGSQVLDMVDGGQWNELANYVASDAWAEMQLFKKLKQVVELM